MNFKKKHYSFKAEVPYFHFIRDVGGVNKKLFSAKLNNDNKTTQVSYSFDTESCKKMYWHTLTHVQRQYLDYTLLSDNTLNSLEKNIVKTSILYKKTTQIFLKKIPCFANVKFDEKDALDFTLNDEFGFAMCNTTPRILISGTKTVAHMWFSDHTKSLYTGALILIDGHNKNLEGDGINAVLQQILHTLGLTHPSYSSLEEESRYRSILEDDQSNNLTNLTPVDVKGLIEIYGESDDNTGYCTNIRNEFYNKYSDYFTLVGDNPHNAEEL